MSILVHCPNPACGKVHKVKSRFAGKRCHCPACNVILMVPDPNVAVSTAPSYQSERASATIDADSTQREAAHPPTEPEPFYMDDVPQIEGAAHEPAAHAVEEVTFFTSLDEGGNVDDGATVPEMGLAGGSQHRMILPTEAEVTLVPEEYKPYRHEEATLAMPARKKSAPQPAMADDDSWDPGAEPAEIEPMAELEDDVDVEEEVVPITASEQSNKDRWLTFGLGVAALLFCGGALASFMFWPVAPMVKTGVFAGEVPPWQRANMDELNVYLPALLIPSFLLAVSLFFHAFWGGRALSIAFGYLNLLVSGGLFVYVLDRFLFVFLVKRGYGAEMLRIKESVASQGGAVPGERVMEIGSGLWCCLVAATVAMILFGVIQYRLQKRNWQALLPVALLLVLIVGGLTYLSPWSEAGKSTSNMKAIQ